MFSMDTIDYLLLDYLDVTPRDLSGLGGAEVDQWVNKPHHKLDIDQLASRLYRLLQEQLIFAEKSKLGRVNLTLDDLYTQLKKKTFFSELPDVSIGMTPGGGELWEQKFNPDWAKYYRGSNSSLGEELSNWTLETQNESLLKQTFEILSRYYIPVPDTLVWEKVEPWQAIYWKTLPRGYRVSYNYQSFMRGIVLPYGEVMTISILTTWRRKLDNDKKGNWIIIEPEAQIEQYKQWRALWRKRK